MQIRNWWRHKWLLREEESQNEEHHWKEWVTLIETWQQYCALRKIEDEAYRDVAMAHWWLNNERKKDLK